MNLNELQSLNIRELNEVAQKLSIQDAQFHGSWGVNITWNDGHNAGIYTFQFLREIAESYLHSGLDLP